MSPPLRPDEFWLVGEMQVLDDRERDVFRFEDLDLAVDHSGVDRRVDAQRVLLLEQIELVSINNQHRLAGVARRGGENVDRGQSERQQHNKYDRRKLPAHKCDERRVELFGRRNVRRRRRGLYGGPSLIDLEHVDSWRLPPESSIAQASYSFAAGYCSPFNVDSHLG